MEEKSRRQSTAGLGRAAHCSIRYCRGGLDAYLACTIIYGSQAAGASIYFGGTEGLFVGGDPNGWPIRDMTQDQTSYRL